MTAIYQGRIDDLDFTLTIHDDGTADAKVRRAFDPLAMWSAPVPLRSVPVSSPYCACGAEGCCDREAVR